MKLKKKLGFVYFPKLVSCLKYTLDKKKGEKRERKGGAARAKVSGLSFADSL